MKKIVTIICCLLVLTSSLFFQGCDEKKNSLKIIDVKLTNEAYAFALKKGNQTLKNALNEYVSRIKEDGSYDKILKKYFSNEGERFGVELTSYAVENSEDKLIVVTNCPFEPFEYVEQDGKIYGIDIEIAKGFADFYGLELVIKNLSNFNSIFTEIDSGHADVGMAGITITPQRKALYDFTDEYYVASQKLIVKGDLTDFDEATTAENVESLLSSLSTESVGYQTGTTGNWYVEGDSSFGFNGFKNINGKGYATAQLAVNDLINGNLYAVVLDEAVAEAIVNSFRETTWKDKLFTFFSYLKTPSWRKLLLKGFYTTVKVAVFGLLIGIVIGTLIAVVKVAPKYRAGAKILDGICSLYVGLFRGTPIVVQLLISYYVLLPAFNLSAAAESVAVWVFGMNSGAYVAEIMRGGINSVDIGQTEGGRALGLTYGKTMLKIVVPQAIKNILPTLGNEFISLIKETSVVSFISVYDLYTVAQAIGSNSYDLTIPYLFLALVYIAVVFLISVAVKLLEKALKGEKRIDKKTTASAKTKEVV